MEPSRQPRAASSGPSEKPTAVYPSPVPAPGAEAEAETLAPALASGDHCASCGSSLAPDQHYCLVCGERRGPARFSALPATGTTTTTLIAEERGSPPSPRFSSAATLIAGVATLLIAMGIGVYIGGLGKSGNGANNQPVRIVTVNGGGVPAATAASATTAAASTGGGGHASKKNAKSAHKSNGGSSSAKIVTVKKLPPPTVTIGASGTGAGYQNGKFTGKFFGP